MAEETGLWLIDGEDAGAGDPWEWDDVVEGGTATFLLSDAAKAHGTYGYRVTGDGATASVYGRKNYTTAAELYFRFYVKLQAGCAGIGGWHNILLAQVMDGATIVFSFGILADGGDPYTIVKWTTSGTGSGLSATQPTTNFSLGARHYVEIYTKTDADGGEGGVKVWVDGDIAYDDMDQNWASEPDRLYVGINNRALADGHVIDFDDIKCDSSPIGAYSDAGGTIVPLLMNYYRRLRS